MSASSTSDEGGPEAPGRSGSTENVTIAILAGGRSWRMGRDKADLDLEGYTFLERLTRVALATGSPVLIVGRPSPPDWQVEGVRFIEDEEPDLGPLGGLVTALRAADAPVLLMACDMPLLDVNAVQWLKNAWKQAREEDDGQQALLPVTDDGRRQPLFAVYDPSVLQPAEENLASSDRSLKSLLARVRSRSIPPPWEVAARIHSVDTPGDYRAMFALPVLPEDLDRLRKRDRQV